MFNRHYRACYFLFAVVGCSLGLCSNAWSQQTGVPPPIPTSPTDRQPANANANAQAAARQLALSSVYIQNLTSTPFRYQIARTSGPAWTQAYSLPSRMQHQFTADDIRQPSVIRTLNLFGKPGYLVIRFEVAGGYETFKILTVNAADATSGIYIYVVNDGGYGDLVQPTPGTIVSRIPEGKEANHIRVLTANHCFIVNPAAD